jgi:hypothetical protein
VNQDGWISVEDRLPKNGVPCLVVYSGVVQFVAYARVCHGFNCSEGYAWTTMEEIEADDIPDEQVTHWQPLPAPPRKGR